MSSTSSPVSVLPRFISIRADNGYSLRMDNNQGLLLFTSPDEDRRSVHEVLYNSNVDGDDSFVIRSTASGRFWTRRSTDSVIEATVERPPPATERASRFQLAEISPNAFALRSALDGNYLKRFTAFVGQQQYRAMIRAPDPFTGVTIADAARIALVLPRYVTFQVNDTKKYMQHHIERQIYWNQFKGDDHGNLLGTYEIVPLLSGNVVLYSLGAENYLRVTGLWIWSEVNDRARALADNSCHYDPIRLSSNMITFRSVSDPNRVCGRYTDHNWQHMFAAESGATLTNPSKHLLVEEAVCRRSVFDVNYILHLAETSDMRTLAVGRGTAINNSTLMSDVEVVVSISQRVARSRNWSSSVTVGVSRTITMTAGVPFVSEVTGSIEYGWEATFERAWGETTEEEVQFETRYTVNDVPPGVTATVTVMASTAKMRIPFTYSASETGLDNVDRPITESIGGFFDGVAAYNIVGVITSSDGTINRSVPAERK